MLRRTHSWVGITCAAAGAIIGISGITLNHRTDFNLQVAQAIENFQLEAPAGGFDAQADFERFLIDSLEINGQRFVPEEEEAERLAQRIAPAAVELGGRLVEQPQRLVTHFASANEQYDARYVEGNTYIDVSYTSRGILQTFNRLHLANFSGIVWVVVIDALSIAMVVLSLTGLLLWSRLTGPRILALGLAGSMLLGILYYALVL